MAPAVRQHSPKMRSTVRMADHHFTRGGRHGGTWPTTRAGPRGSPARVANRQRLCSPRRRRAAAMAVPPVPSRATPAAAISASGQPVVGRPPPGGLEDGPGAGAWLGAGEVGAGGVGAGEVGGGEVGGGEVGGGEVGGGEVGGGEVGGGEVGAPHATQNTFCLALPCWPVKFQNSL